MHRRLTAQIFMVLLSIMPTFRYPEVEVGVTQTHRRVGTS